MSFEPETALIKCSTSKGKVTMEMYREWSPNGFDRVVSLYEQGFYDQSHFYRVIPGYMVQFGISYTEDAALKAFADEPITDDPMLEPPIEFEEGTISFSADAEHGRTSQLLIAHGKISSMGSEKWEVPIGKVIEGMPVLKSFRSYGDIPPFGSGPDQELIRSQGKKYVENSFPLLEYIEYCTVERRGGFLPQQETRSQLEALGDKFAFDMQPNTEQLAFFGVVTMLFCFVAFLGTKKKSDEDKDQALIDMFTEEKVPKQVRFSAYQRSTRKQNRRRTKSNN